MFSTFCCSFLLTCGVPSLRTDPWTGRYHFRYGHKTHADYNPSICAYITWHHWAQSVMESMESAFVHLSPQMFLLPSGCFYPHLSPFCVVPQTKQVDMLSQTCFSASFCLPADQSECSPPGLTLFPVSLSQLLQTAVCFRWHTVGQWIQMCAGKRNFKYVVNLSRSKRCLGVPFSIVNVSAQRVQCQPAS